MQYSKPFFRIAGLSLHNSKLKPSAPKTAAFRDPLVYPDPDQIKLDRPIDLYQMWSMGPHRCAGRAIAITAVASMVKACAQLKNLRRAPGDQGRIKYVSGPLPGSRKYLSDDWSRYQPFAGSKSVIEIVPWSSKLISNNSLEGAFR